MLKGINCRHKESEALVELRCAHTTRYQSHLLGAKIAREGLIFWCKDCRSGHLLTWEQLEEERQAVAFPESVR